MHRYEAYGATIRATTQPRGGTELPCRPFDLYAIFEYIGQPYVLRHAHAVVHTRYAQRRLV